MGNSIQGLHLGFRYGRDSRVGNESMSGSLPIEEKRSLHVRAADPHHRAEGAITDT
jgi:hypothetical protein